MASTTGAASVTISPTAYKLVILHAAKHPSRTITGLLIGTQSASSITVQHVVPLQHHWAALSTIPQVGTSLADAHFKQSQPPLQVLGAYEANAALDARSLSPSTVRLCARIAERNSKGGVPALGLLLQNALLLTPTNAALLPFHIPASSAALETSSRAVVSKKDSGSAPVDVSSEIISLKGAAVQIDGGLEGAVKETKDAVGRGVWKSVVDFDGEPDEGRIPVSRVPNAHASLVPFSDHLENTSLDWLGNADVVKTLRL